MRDEGEVLMKRNTVEEGYLQIVADLNEAERLFLTPPHNNMSQTTSLAYLWCNY